MRDDLHRTVPMTRPWQSVMKYATREADWTRVPFAMSRAVQLEVSAGLETKWINGLREGLRPAETDFFEDARLASFIDEFGHQEMTPRERQLLEITKGLLSRDGGANLYDHAFAELHRQVLDADIEQIVARVREIYGARQAFEVKQGLVRAAINCPFEQEFRIKKPSKHDSVAGLLSETIMLNIA